MIELAHGGTYDVQLTTDTGHLIADLDQALQFAYVKSLDLPGTWSLTLPETYPDRYWAKDRTIRFWRRGPSQASASLDFFGLLRRWRYVTDSRGRQLVILSGYDQTSLLDRRIIAYPADTAKAKVESTEIDNAIKAIVRNNFGTLATDTNRALDANQFTVQPDRGAGETISKAFAWRPAGQVIRDLAALSREQGPEILYWIRVDNINPDGSARFRFETATNYLGRDRGRSSPRPMIFGQDLGNMANTVLDYDYTEEVNHIYAGGQGEGEERYIIEVEDDIAQRESQWARVERFVDGRNSPDTQLGIEAWLALANGAAVLRFGGDILDTPLTPYGDWNLGDLVTVIHRGIEFDTIVRAVKVQMSGGREDIAAKVQEVL